MLIFHAGLPGAGKSYEAMLERIIPSLKQGREVVAYVEGIDHAKCAELAEIPEDRCRALLTALTREQVEGGIVAHAKDNAMMVLDEAQNFWGTRAKMDKTITEFVSEHRHRGIDIVLMGQDLRDVNVLWRRRIDIKLQFLQLNGLGTSKRYSVTTYRHKGQDEFEKVGTQVRKYDPRYFGSYASVVNDDISTKVYTDKRATVWSKPVIRYGMPAAVLMGLWGITTAYRFFYPADPKPVTAVHAGPSKPAPVAVAASVAAPAAPAAVVDERSPQEKRLADLSARYRIRLAGLLQRGDRVQGVVEWIDGGTRIIERFTLDQLRDLGVAVIASDGFVRLGVGQWNELATMWPLEAPGRASNAVVDELRPAVAATPQNAPPVVIDVGRRGAPQEREPAAPLTVDRGRARS